MSGKTSPGFGGSAIQHQFIVHDGVGMACIVLRHWHLYFGMATERSADE